MAGHSKWANIKHRKGAKDAKKAKLYTKLVKEIIVATQQGGAILADNARLRLAVQNAKSANLPKENIIRAIRKASGGENTNYIAGCYEGTIHGVAVIVVTMGDNANRVVANVRAVFNKHGGSMAKNGSVVHLFAHKGIFVISAIPETETTTLALIDSGMDALEKKGHNFYLTCPVQRFGAIQKVLEAKRATIQKSMLAYWPYTTVQLQETTSAKVKKLIEALEDLDDVEHVYHNLAVENRI